MKPRESFLKKYADFIEWAASGEIAGKPLRLGVTDRYTPRGMLAVESVAYFDALAPPAFTDPNLAGLAGVSIGAAHRSDDARTTSFRKPRPITS